jgi:arabinofuranan 3-O-arabinosyltransferase
VVDGSWTQYEQIVTVGASTTSLQVTLHADVGSPLRPETVAEYRGLRIEALDQVAEQTVWPPAVPEVAVDLAAGRHELRVDGGVSGSVLAQFEDLEDCFRYDDRTTDEAGLALRVDTSADGETTYGLGATGHLACIAATAPDFGGASLYELSMEARSIAVRNPKFCVFLRGPDRCLTMPSVALWDGWTPYQALLTPDPAAVETRLYLYGLRDLAERQQSMVEYRGVRLRPVASPTTVVLVRQTPEGQPAEVRWNRVNPATYRATVRADGPTALALAETAAPGWSVSGPGTVGARPVTLQGWMNGWLLPGDADVTIAYGPATLSRYALAMLPVTAAIALAWILADLRRPGWIRRRFRGRLGSIRGRLRGRLRGSVRQRIRRRGDRS